MQHSAGRRAVERQEVTLRVDGMMCEHCEAHVKEALEHLPQVRTAVADHTTGAVKVTLTAPVKENAFRKAIQKEGYSFVGIE